MIKSIFCTTLVLFLAHHVGRAQIVVNPDGTHSVVTGNVIVNPDGSHSVVAGNVIINSNGTHSILAGNVIVNSNGTHSVIAGNVLVNPDGSHTILPGAQKSTNKVNRQFSARAMDRERGYFEKWLSRLFGKSQTANKPVDTLRKLQ